MSGAAQPNGPEIEAGGRVVDAVTFPEFKVTSRSHLNSVELAESACIWFSFPVREAADNCLRGLSLSEGAKPAESRASDR